jgi:hypothetical protein
MGVGTDNVFRIGGWSASNDCLQLDSAGRLTLLTDVRAPIYYDSNNTAFYFDGASTTNINALSGQGKSILTTADTYLRINEAMAFTSGTWFGGVMIRTGGIWAGSSGGTDARIAITGGSYNGSTVISLNGTDGIVTATGDMRSPIFYDSNNTAFYTDPAGTSILNGLTVGTGGSSSITMVDSDEGDRILHCNSNRIGFLTQAGAWGAWCADDGTWQTDVAVWAPVFYDQNNTAYYFDGSSTAANALTVAGGIHVSVGNVTGQGIILADDGDIVDLNDGYCAMRFSSGVRVHSGNRTGSAVVALTSGGAVIASGDITAFGSPSDIKLKYNIENIPNALEKLLTLNGVNFNYKKDGARSTGVIAQEVEEVLPEVIYEATNPEGTEHFKAVRYGNMVGLLIEAIKEQQAHINRLEEKINSMNGS